MQYYTYLRRKYANNLNYCFAVYEIHRMEYITLTDTNPTYRKVLQIPSPKYKHKKLTDLMRLDYAQHIMKRLFDFIQMGKSHCIGWQYIHPEMTDLWENSLTIKNTRETIKIYEIFKKITSPSPNTSAFNPYFKSPHTLYCSANDIVIMLNVQSNHIVIENINKKQLFGLPFSKVIGKSIEAFPVLDGLRTYISACMKTRNIVDSDKQIDLNKDGAYWSLSFTPLIQSNCCRVLIYAQDVTDSVRAQQQIIDLTEELNLSFANATDALCVYLINEDRQMIVERENLLFIKLREEFKKANHPFLPKDAMKEVIDGQEPYTQNLCLRQENNIIRYFQLYLDPILNGRIIHKIFVRIRTLSEGPLPLKTPLPFSSLTNREQEILKLLLDGCTNKFISFKLSISEGTVKKIIYNIYKKLNVSSRVEIIKLFLK